MSSMSKAVIVRMRQGAIMPRASNYGFRSIKAGIERRLKPAMSIRATVPPVTNKTFRDSKVGRLDKEEGLVTKNSHSMKA